MQTPLRHQLPATPSPADAPIVVVSGLPRSGTSMMMQILAAGGLELITDHQRPADMDNPAGYFELERVKHIEKDASWLPGARGKAFKMVSLLLLNLPPAFQYKIVFMHRNLDEILASQFKMLARRGAPLGPSDARMAQLFTRHLAELDDWLQAQNFLKVLPVRYTDVLRDPRAKSAHIRDFLGIPLDIDRMASAVDSSMHHNKS